MKFFTIDWWMGAQDDSEQSDPIEAYWRYIDSIRDRLLPTLVRVQSELSLHDAQLTDLAIDFGAGTLYIVLDSDDGNTRYRRITLNYSGVSAFESTANRDKWLPGPWGYGDLGYDEVDLFGDSFEHRFLFSTGIEMRIIFREFSFSYIDEPQINAPPQAQGDGRPAGVDLN